MSGGARDDASYLVLFCGLSVSSLIMYTCQECAVEIGGVIYGSYFDDHDNFKSHYIEIHNSEKVFICTHCNFYSNCQDDLSQHLLHTHDYDNVDIRNLVVDGFLSLN